MFHHNPDTFMRGRRQLWSLECQNKFRVWLYMDCLRIIGYILGLHRENEKNMEATIEGLGFRVCIFHLAFVVLTSRACSQLSRQLPL